MYNTATLARNIRRARLYRNYSQDYLAYKLNMSQNGYSRIELGQTTLSVEKLIIIAETLEVDIAKLITEPDTGEDIANVNAMPLGPQLLELVCKETGLGFAAIARVTERQWVACCVLDKISFGLKAGEELELETTLCNEIRQHQRAVVIDEVATDQAFAGHPTPARYGFQSYISVPVLRQDGSFFGTLCAIDPKPAKLDRPEVLAMFRLFTQLIYLHLDSAERTAFREPAFPAGTADSGLLAQVKAVLGEELPAAVRELLGVSPPVMNRPSDDAPL